MNCCKSASYQSTFWHYHKEEEGSNLRMKQCHVWLEPLRVLLHVARTLSNWQPVLLGCLLKEPASQEEKKNKKRKTWGTAGWRVGVNILADFDKLIIEQTGNTRLICVIIVNMAYLPRRNFMTRGYSWMYSTQEHFGLPNVQVFGWVCWNNNQFKDIRWMGNFVCIFHAGKSLNRKWIWMNYSHF